MKKTLIVVDMQNDFIDMALGTDEAVAILPKVKDKIRRYVANGDEVLFTRDTHDENYLNTPEGQKLPVPHCIRGTKGWEIAPGLYVEGCKIIDKPNFGWPHWNEETLEDVELIGLCTDICVVSNALIIKATFPYANVTVDASCCAGVTPESHNAALTTMQMCQINIINNGKDE
jgi:nicotinamidase-related amidase